MPGFLSNSFRPPVPTASTPLRFPRRRLRSATNPLALAALGALVGCGVPNAPRIHHPVSIESFCGTREARATAIESVLTSTDDRLLDEKPTRAAVVAAVKTPRGVIAHWNDQLLKLPTVSAALGETDGFARVSALGIPYAPEGATSRTIYLLVRDHGSPRWIEMSAYDVQDICLEGKPQT